VSGAHAPARKDGVGQGRALTDSIRNDPNLVRYRQDPDEIDAQSAQLQGQPRAIFIPVLTGQNLISNDDGSGSGHDSKAKVLLPERVVDGTLLMRARDPTVFTLDD
jgi:hypothetical protein